MSLIRKAFFGALVGVLAFFIFTRNSEQEKSELNIEMGSLGKALIVGWTGLVILVNRRNGKMKTKWEGQFFSKKI